MFRSTTVALLAILTFCTDVRAQDDRMNLLDMKTRESFRQVTASSNQVTVTRNLSPLFFTVTIKPGNEGYPGIAIAPPSGNAWDLSDFGHVEARITNTGSTDLAITLRIDNAGDWQTNPWNGENLYLKPGQTGTGKVIFGHSWGKPGFALKSDAVTKVMIFTGKTDKLSSFRIDSVEAAGKAGETIAVDPGSIRIVPENGKLLTSDSVIEAMGATVGRTESGAIQASFAPGSAEQSITIRPSAGRWDLREHLQIVIELKNTGPGPIKPTARLQSNSGPTDLIASAQAIAPESTGQIVVPFASKVIWSGPKETGSHFSNDATSAVVISVPASTSNQAIDVYSVNASVPPPPAMPDWVGQRPPVTGEWTKTFSDEFDRPIDPKVWNIYTENYWDKRSHFSKDNVILEDGMVHLRFEKKRGYHNDDTQREQTDYQTGFLDTYGKWVQRYGYFEARTKLPTAPGLWPAFWLMPDRGKAAGEQWQRADTGNSGMEFDIMEYLSRWGPNRYNIAVHYDGYADNHKAIGSERVYFRPDADGFITAGLLWLPGEATFYAQGEIISQWKNPRVSTVPSYPIFTAVSGGWDNAPIDDSKLPSDFVIDYIRVWQRKDLASKVDGFQ